MHSDLLRCLFRTSDPFFIELGLGKLKGLFSCQRLNIYWSEVRGEAWIQTCIKRLIVGGSCRRCWEMG